MLSQNLYQLRKEKGYTQEGLAQQLNVVRQTVSKWEKGLSVPDAEMLNTIAELFEVPVSDLLGDPLPEAEPIPSNAEIAKQLAILNTQLATEANRKRELRKKIGIGLLITVVVVPIVYLALLISYRYITRKDIEYSKTTMACTLDGNEYGYELTYDQNYQMHASGGDAWISNHIHPEQYGNDANVLIAKIEDYFKDRGGSCESHAEKVEK